MLLYGHELDDVVACLFDHRYVEVGKISVCVDFFLFSSHANMCFVDPVALRSWNILYWPLIFPLEFFIRVPKHTIKQIRIFVLNLVGCPSRIFIFRRAIRSSDGNFVLLQMLDFGRTVLISFQGDQKLAVFVLLTDKFVSVPVVEITKNRHF